jgi:hypothetical protein
MDNTQMVDEEVVVLDTEFVYFELKNDILIATYKPNLEIDLIIAKEIVKSRLEFCKKKSYPTLADITAIKNIVKDARDYFSSAEAAEGITAGALVSKSSFTTIIGNFFLKIAFIKTQIPTRMFTDKQKAIDWLTQYN